MQRLPGAIFQQDNAWPHTARLSPQTCPIPIFVSNRAYLGSFGMVSQASHEFEGTRSKVTANMERKVSKHHTELVCLNARSSIRAVGGSTRTLSSRCYCTFKLNAGIIEERGSVPNEKTFTAWASSRSRLSLNKITIQIFSAVFSDKL
ncbi:transposable element Tcb1 transposase [Trichonephila clavipes]|nr:transposable element Tcb1 transposase [Trichonephila clavipes]